MRDKPILPKVPLDRRVMYDLDLAQQRDAVAAQIIAWPMPILAASSITVMIASPRLQESLPFLQKSIYIIVLHAC